jgi:P-loop Nucleotide Kinase3
VTYDLVYLVGPPGVGKSSLMEALTTGWDRFPVGGSVPHDLLLQSDDPVVAIELGKRRDSFSGTDALGMSVQPKAVEWIATRPHRLILGEGSRLATVGFLHAARAAGYRVHLVQLDASDSALAARRTGRGSNQNETWMRGATTRARRLVERMGLDVTTLLILPTDEATPAQIAAQVVENVPELEVLR